MKDSQFNHPVRVLTIWSFILVLALSAGVAVNLRLWPYVEELRRTDPYTYTEAAQALLQANDLAGALLELEEGARNTPDSPICLKFAGDIYYENKRHEQSLKAYGEALRRGDKSEDVRGRIIWLLIALERHDELVDFCTASIQQGYTSAEFLRHVAQGFHKAGKLNDAVTYYEKALEGFPNDLYLMPRLLQVYQRLGKTKKAQELRERIDQLETLIEAPPG